MSKQAKTLSDETVRAIREEVDAGIKSRLADYQRQVKAFLAGLSVFLLLILGDHFLRNDQFVNFLREQVVAFGPQLARFLGKKVAFSYSNEYWIQAPTYQEESLAFFASEPQEVTALINIVHKGTGPRLPIS